MFRDSLNLMESDVRSCFVFRIGEAAGRFPPLMGKPRPFRDPAAVPIAEQIAEGLQRRQYRTSKVRPGKACHAGFECQFDGMYVDVILMLHHDERAIECSLHTRPWRSLLRRRIQFSSEEIQEWSRLAATLDDVVRANLRPDSYEWVTFRELEEKEER